VERPSWENDGGLVVGLCFALNAFPATVCVSLSLFFGPSSLHPFREPQTLPSRCPHFI
jgi:hypothetical protein